MAPDPYKYFRVEAKDLLEGLQQGAVDLEKGLVTPDLVRSLLRMAHTLKGAARVVKQTAIADLAHAVEDVLAPHREGRSSPRAGEMRGLLDRIGEGLGSIAQTVRVEEPVETVRVDLEETERLLESAFETRVHLSAIEAELGTGPEFRRIRAAVERTAQELEQVRECAERLRLVPVSTIFGALERTARDAAASLRKKVAFRATGGGSRVDGHVLTPIRDALLQIVRNAVAHGIEREGRVELRVERRGSQVVFTVTDDGRGIDAEAVRRAAGSTSPLTTEQAVELLLRGGVTTSATATEHSGRGVGLDIVREAVRRLRGTVSIRTGRGTTVEIVVPVSLSAIPALAVEAGGIVAALPLDRVRTTLRVAKEDLGAAILVGGSKVPFQFLATILGRPSRTAACTAVVLDSAALGVDRVVGTGIEVVRPLSAWVRADPVVAGASLDAHGRPRPMLDPEAVAAAVRAPRERTVEASEVVRPPILVIDDSLTTRMLEQSILESAGYAVDLATSGEEALLKARSKSYGLFIVDVEMPGMDGFEFLVRAPREVPAILVTSRNSSEDRRRGAELGAKAYVVKSEFDQKRLLSTIRGLL